MKVTLLTSKDNLAHFLHPKFQQWDSMIQGLKLAITILELLLEKRTKPCE
jgi:hypothetical protein